MYKSVTALHGHCSVVEFMLSSCNYGNDIQDCCGTTPLMDAIRAGHVDIAKILINRKKVWLVF